MLLRELMPGSALMDERPYETILLSELRPGAVMSDERP
jgi:hypothetical protein